jgi:hypothetical protein
MDDFDRLLDAELGRILDPIVRTPAPRRTRGWSDGRLGRIRIFQGGLPEAIPAAVPVTVGVRPSVP